MGNARKAPSYALFHGCFSCKTAVTLATRRSLPTAALTLATSLVAIPCAAQDPSALALVGTRAIDVRDFGEALEAFTKAATMRRDDASICFGAGVAAFMIGQDDEARSRFECALTLKPSFLPAAMWLADLHYRAGRLAEAIAVYETARRHSRSSNSLQPQLDAWRKEHALQSTFQELRTEHFIALFARAAERAHARAILNRLEAAYLTIGNTLGLYPGRPIIVVLYTREQYAEITGLAEWSSAAYDGRIRVALGGAMQQAEELDRVLSHELVHAIVAAAGGRSVPEWLNEGLATLLEPVSRDDLDAALERSGAAIELSQLHDSFARFSTRSDAEIAYGLSVRAVRRLIEKRGMAALVDLLKDLGRGVPFARAFEQRIGMRYEDFANF